MGSVNRRGFLRNTSGAFGALLATGCMAGRTGLNPAPAAQLYGPLVPDPAGLMDLPEGFSYRVISRLGDAMDDGARVPDRADGMGSFLLADGRIALVRNHELQPQHDAAGDFASRYDHIGGAALAGGTTTLVLDPETLAVERQYRSLAGTIRNCAGGTTPWGSWLTCEENTSRAGEGSGGRVLSRDHGYVFEVPAAHEGLVDPVPLTAMGRFNHEAAIVDPATGMVYLTEDRDDSLLYRFTPATPGRLADGGRLQAMALISGPQDSRNWAETLMPPGSEWRIRWIDLDNVEAPADDLRTRGAARGATIFARGEGIHMGDGEMFFCCTSGGAKQLGQIFRLDPRSDRLQLFFESSDIEQFNYGDNLTVAPNGHLIVCEDAYTEMVDNHLRGITPDGRPYALGRLRIQTEPAGACFSPDGRTLFVNAYSPAMTLAIQGPWVA
ncbi:alkaline phosphatase PhoX [Croceicoccus sp. YJ47]|uniref:alkaline phosphatase PhoX n=1 Tax=Croceicoccus sp. YJ47 TaxID=2798724 RepID=UPI001923E20E|nr:alkaline phosphatase PhoX [Croceicoccus sp. YJ47]QQN73318.1 DUF839 domain-containing protein [Croceicoccus sp. YJ47]